jgi:hypothetical protein
VAASIIRELSGRTAPPGRHQQRVRRYDKIDEMFAGARTRDVSSGADSTVEGGQICSPLTQKPRQRGRAGRAAGGRRRSQDGGA